MKRLNTPLFICLFSLGTVAAQNYEPVKPGVMHVYSSTPIFTINNNKTLPLSHTLYADSFSVKGSDTGYYNYAHFQEFNPGCIKIGRNFFTGPQIWKKPNGEFWFITKTLDTMVLKTHTQINDTFVYLQEKSKPGFIYLAVTTSKQVENFYTNSDSVITYTLFYYNQNGQIIPSPTNGKKIKLSKNHGIIQYVFAGDSIEFQQTWCSQPQTGAGLYPTFRNIFEMNVADEREYLTTTIPSSMPGTYERHQVLTKRDFMQGDSTAYTIRRITVRPGFYLDLGRKYIPTVWKIDTIRIGYNWKAMEHNEYLTLTDINYGCYNIDFQKSNVVFYLEFRGDVVTDFNQTDSCWRGPILMGFAPRKTYEPGAGMVFSNGYENIGGTDFYTHRQLYYYKTGSKVVGSPQNFNLLMSVSEPNGSIPGFKIYPNPIKDKFYFTLPTQELYSITITNTIGQQVAQKQFEAGQGELDLSGLPAGIYFYTLQLGNKETVTGKIVKQ